MTDLATKIATSTTDAYSFYAYGTEEWMLLTTALLERGFTADQTETILRSKITRWARDAYAKNDEGVAKYVLDYIDNEPNALRGLFDNINKTVSVKVTIEVYVKISAHDETAARNGAMSNVIQAVGRATGFAGIGDVKTIVA